MENNIINNSTKVFIPEKINPQITDKIANCTYYASAVFRGLESDVLTALHIIYPKSSGVLKYSTKLSDSVRQFECASAFVPKIIIECPRLKCVFFAEYWKENKVYLAYSESGYNTVTSIRVIYENENFYIRDRWSLIHDPTEDGMLSPDEKSAWEKLDYVLPEGNKQLVSSDVIKSYPYKKKTKYSPCEIIKIVYPEHEVFYEPPKTEPKPTEKPAAKKRKTPVVADDKNYSSPNQFIIDDGVLREYRKKRGITRAAIPDGVTTITYRAFGSCKDLTEITIPDSVTNISGWAFDCCGNLTEITLPDSVTYIGDCAFQYCRKLSRIKILGKIISWGDGYCNYDFGYATKIKEIIATKNKISDLRHNENCDIDMKIKKPLMYGFINNSELYSEDVVDDYIALLRRTKKNYIPMILEDDNVKALTLYEKLGFITAKNIENDYLTPATAADAKQCVEFLLDWQSRHTKK